MEWVWTILEAFSHRGSQVILTSCRNDPLAHLGELILAIPWGAAALPWQPFMIPYFIIT